MTVTLDTTALVCNNLTIGGGTSGTLQYQATPLAGLTVNGSITINSGGTFTAGAGVLTTHTLAVGGTASTVSAGSITNNGTFDMNTTAGVTVTFAGNINGTLSGAGATYDFFSITVNKGTTSAPILDVTSVITINAPAVAASNLTVTAGTFRLSSASTLTPYFGAATISASAGRLWLNNAAASIQCVGTGTTLASAGSPTVTGELRIDNGTFGYGAGANTLTLTSGSGILTMNGGTLNMFGAVLVLKRRHAVHHVWRRHQR